MAEGFAGELMWANIGPNSGQLRGIIRPINKPTAGTTVVVANIPLSFIRGEILRLNEPTYNGCDSNVINGLVYAVLSTVGDVHITFVIGEPAWIMVDMTVPLVPK